MVVEVEVGGQVGLQLARQVILIERHVLGFDAARKAFAGDVVEGAAVAIDAGLNVGCEQAGVCRCWLLTIELALHVLGDQVHYTLNLVVQFLGSTSTWVAAVFPLAISANMISDKVSRSLKLRRVHFLQARKDNRLGEELLLAAARQYFGAKSVPKPIS